VRTASLTDTGSVSIPPRTTRGTDEKRRMLLRYLLVVLAVGQPASSLVFDWLSPTTLQSGAEFSPLVPPGAWFAIWGVIILLSPRLRARAGPDVDAHPSAEHPRPRRRAARRRLRLLRPVARDRRARAGQPARPRRLHRHHQRARRRLDARRPSPRRARRLEPLERGLLYGLLGTYSGWTSMAFFVQIGTVVQGSGAPVDTAWGQAWQLLVLLAASGLAVAFVLGSRASIVYAATVTYALIGVGLSAVRPASPCSSSRASRGHAGLGIRRRHQGDGCSSPDPDAARLRARPLTINP